MVSFVLVLLGGLRGAYSFQSIHTIQCSLKFKSCRSFGYGTADFNSRVQVAAHPLPPYCLQAKTEWSTDDDWGRLSNKEDASPLPVDGEDLARIAAASMEQPVIEVLSKEDEWIYNSVEEINDSALDSETPSYAIYDAPGDVIQIAMEDDVGQQIAMLVRCNESPEEMLIAEGRALSPLTEEELNDISQLVSHNAEDGTWETTDFFRNAIGVIYREHATSDGIMKHSGVASWMSKSLDNHVSAHDKRVLTTIARFSEYGSGCLTADNFQEVYVASLSAALDGSNRKIGRRTGIKGQPTVDTIWRDIRTHNILSPVEAEREIKMLEIRKKAGDLNIPENSAKGEVMDECEIFDIGHTYATTTYQTSMSDVKEKEFTSHELLEMAPDGKTPLYLRDGDFIFIDEESCIGCTQCAAAAPSSFLMLDHGRARTFEQRNDPDVAAAVAVCPVTCMHRVSFDELKELEIAREKGDGRTDHKHLGTSKGYTPLHVSRRGSDANKKDSWYHYLKQKCYCKLRTALVSPCNFVSHFYFHCSIQELPSTRLLRLSKLQQCRRKSLLENQKYGSGSCSSNDLYEEWCC